MLNKLLFPGHLVKELLHYIIIYMYVLYPCSCTMSIFASKHTFIGLCRIVECWTWRIMLCTIWIIIFLYDSSHKIVLCTITYIKMYQINIYIGNKVWKVFFLLDGDCLCLFFVYFFYTHLCFYQLLTKKKRKKKTS